MFFKLKTATIEEAVTEVLKKIPLDDMKECVFKLVDRSKCCIALNREYFE